MKGDTVTTADDWALAVVVVEIDELAREEKGAAEDLVAAMKIAKEKESSFFP